MLALTNENGLEIGGNNCAQLLPLLSPTRHVILPVCAILNACLEVGIWDSELSPINYRYR